ncbi:MAG: TonB-dependent receptor family protein, partial [Gemmatimonadales bacterium]
VGSYELILGDPTRPLATRQIRITAGQQTEISIAATSSNARKLSAVVVSATQPLHVIGHLSDVQQNVIYSGKKTEVLLMDSLRANTAQDIERQILGRVPGANFSETEGAGFPSNGVGFRGLDPTQSVELNTRQNGVGIAADLYGYPETYYTPPSEALQRIEVVRGAGSLAFGPQFGGSINYVVREGTPNSAPVVTSAQTGGSYGLVNSFNSVGGGSGSWTYYGFAHFRSADGWRANSDSRQGTAYGSVKYRASDRLQLGLEYTSFRNRIHMPGGLSDSQFAADPSQSLRSRNWLASPWNIVAARASYEIAPNARLETVLSYMTSQRYLVWRNEAGGPAAPDAIDPSTGEFVPREVERESFHNGTLESRLRIDHTLLGRRSTLATGARIFRGTLGRFAGGPGSTGSGFDMRLYGGTWERALNFGTTNLAAFAEDVVHVTDRLSVTPGVRYEYVRSTARGYTDVGSTFAPRSSGYPLLGVGAQYVTTASTQLYANVSGAYRPILYEAMTPLGSVTRVAPNLHSARGYNADLGWRGMVHDLIKFDVSAFYLSYHDHIGTRSGVDASGAFTETANLGNSVHKGVETYIELDPLSHLAGASAFCTLDLFSSLAYIDARYVSGEFRGNRVEQAPRVLARTGATYTRGPTSMTLQASHTASSFGDANNNVAAPEDAAAGLVPAYTVLDLSGMTSIGPRYAVTYGVNNLGNTRYFTKRTGEYPGPGILPGIGRSLYGGIRAMF